jgi:hypothetical protein
MLMVGGVGRETYQLLVFKKRKIFREKLPCPEDPNVSYFPAPEFLYAAAPPGISFP